MCPDCKRRLTECVCPKERLNGKWPKGTWLQERLKEVRTKEAEEHRTTYQRGSAFEELIWFVALFCLVLTALWFYANCTTGAMSVIRCIDDMWKCASA